MLLLATPLWAADPAGPQALAGHAEAPQNPGVFLAAGVALFPAIAFGFFLVYLAVVRSRLAPGQMHQRLVLASVAAIGLTVLIVCGESIYFLFGKPAAENARSASSSGAGFDFDFDGSKCESEARTARDALSRLDYNGALAHIDRAIHYNKTRSDLKTTRAVINLAAGQIDDALLDLNAVLKDNPHDPEALLARSRAFFAKKDYDRCAADAAELIAQKKHGAEAEIILAQIKVRKNDLAGEKVEFEKALKIDPENTAALAGLGDCLYAGADVQAALHSYDAAIKPQSKSGELLYKRGRCLYSMGKYQEAFDDLFQAVQDKPDVTEYRRALAQVYDKQDKLPAALDELDQALHQDPYDEETIALAHLIAERLAAQAQAQLSQNHDNASAHAMLSYAMYMLKSYDGSLNAIERAIALDPRNARNYFLAGECAIEAKQDRRALAFLEKALQLEPKNINVIFEMARAQSDMENFQESIRSYSRFLSACPESCRSAGYVSRGICYMNLRDLKNAVADFSEGLRYTPNNAEVHALRGDAYGCLEDRSHAMGDLQTAIRLDPERALCRRNYTNELMREGNFPAALEAARQSVLLRPRDPSMHSLLSQVFWLMGDYQQALNEVNIAVELDPSTARIKSQQAATFWIMGKTQELHAACNILKNGTEGKDKGKAYADVYFSGLWPYIFYSSLGDRASAEGIMKAASARMDGQVWPYPIFQYLRHNTSADELLKARSDLWSLTEVHCYVGCAQYYNGEKAEAKKNLKWVVEKGRKDFLEYLLALGLVRQNNW
jgi:tetratricopeptide (TPR) repeat protein